MHQLYNIPEELRVIPSWVVWRYEPNDKGVQTKRPYSIRGYPASPVSPKDWTQFEVALQTAQQWGAEWGVGFVLSPADPYSIIDLDNKPDNPATAEQLERHRKIMETFDSYTELSTSGTGVHIIVRGKVPSGRNKDHVELYSSGRFMVMTGNVVKNEPIRDYDEVLQVMHANMASESDHGRVGLVQEESHYSDEELMEMAMNAENGHKFNELCLGDWQGMGYGSQSEADLALISILAFYTKDNEQIRRIFRMTNLGKREKAVKNDTYLNYTIGLVRAKEPPPVNMAALTLDLPKQPEPIQGMTMNLISCDEVEEIVSEAFPAQPMIQAGKPDLLCPPGLIGEIAAYIYATSVRPVKEYAMSAAITMLAGITGRAYNISNTGLNQYFVVLGGTGTGKEGMASGIDALFAAAQTKVPMVDQFMGPGVFASGQGFNKTLEEKQCFVSVLSEFAHMLAAMVNPRAGDHQIALKGNLLKAYSSSGPHQVYKGTAYSDREKNIKGIRAPNVTFLGECTPEYFFKLLSEDHAADGFIPRLLICQYDGGRVAINDHANFPPPPDLVQKIADLATASIQVQSQNMSVPIQQDDDARILLRQYNDHIDARMNSMPEGPIRQILNRSHLKSLKLAGLLAVGVNPYAPVVTYQLAQWAIAFIERADDIMISRFQSGEIGEGDTQMEPVIRKAIESYRAMSVEYRVKNAKCPRSLAELPVIPFASIRDFCKRRDPFKDHKLGYSRALEIALDDLCKAGVLVEIPPQQLPAASNGQKPKAYGLGESY